MTQQKTLFTDLSRDALTAWCQEQGFPAYRADQIRRWIYGKRVNSFDEMHDVPKALRELLTQHYDIFSMEIERHLVSSDGTEKLLLRLADGEHTECVLMRESDRRTVCISSQVGCAMGCVFCASGLLGVKRNLSTGEILEQILRLDRLLPPEERITNVVLMGMGEPLANLKNVIPALNTLNENGALGIGARRITVSTVGLPDKIRELAALDMQFNLAISLHAPTDQLRTEIVPVNKGTGIQEIMRAANEYFQKTGRRVSYEYCLLGGVNDGEVHARQLAALLKGENAHVNLIPMNPVDSLSLQAPTQPRTKQFVDTLTTHGVNVTTRKRKGADIDAACGQLRLKQEQSQSTNVTVLPTDLSSERPVGE
ncbi:MAG: 23S rRNA (adenine(2503)-C(2))-methyltransferase RlmN [Planctomycetaceae bacterium]|nr:23S rRNA (adenine(2503)-C(2))-methyltransferase RlmN [Planctomycetaceae bacterium]